MAEEKRIAIDTANLANWSLDDLEALEKSSSIYAMMSLLDVVVVGGVRGHGYTVGDLKAIQAALFAEIGKLGNPLDVPSGKA